jgi:hypothetical protein
VSLTDDAWLVTPGQRHAIHAVNLYQSGLDRMTAFRTARRERAQPVEASHHVSGHELWGPGLSRCDFPGIIND